MMLATLDGDQRIHIQERFKERIKYLDRLGGTNQEAIIHMSLQSDGKFMFDEFFVERLEILSGNKLSDTQKNNLKNVLGLAGAVELTSADALKKKYGLDDAAAKKLILSILTSGRNSVEADRANAEAEVRKTTAGYALSIEEFSRDLLGVWKTEAAEKFIRDDLRIDNPTGVSLSALALRSRMPPDVLKTLSDAKYDVSVGLLISIAKMPKYGDGGKLGIEAAKAIVDQVTESTAAGGRFRLKSDKLLLDYLTFISFKDDGAKAATDAAGSLNRLETTKVIEKQADGHFLVDIAKLTEELKNMSVDPKTKTMYDSMKSKDIDKVTWKEAASMYASEIWKLAEAGTGIWWDYIKSIPKNFWDPDGDGDLLKILNKEKALEKSRKALQSLLDTSNGAKDLLAKSSVGLGQLRGAQEQALRGDAVTTPRDNIEQARALLMANQYVIGQLNVLGWQTRSLRLRQLTLWMAMHKSTKKDAESGIKEAMKLLQDSAALRTPEEQDVFVDAYLAKHPKDRTAFQEYTDARAVVETNEGNDILSPYKQRGLNLRPDALTLLRQAKDPVNPALNLAAGIGRWLIDPPEKVSTSLDVIFEDGPAKGKYIEAFVTGKDQTYLHQGRTELVSVTDARMAVIAFQERLLFEMRGRVKGQEQIADEQEFSNPVDGWLRTGVDAIKDLWSTDMIGKAEVIAMAVAAFFLIREMWKSKSGKVILLGLPILLGVNAIVKQRTGRDLLGENLRWKSKEDRQSPLEQFRRRGAAIDKRYQSLMQPSGQAAMRVLMNEKNPVRVSELLAWRNAVKSGGGKYSTGLPPSLNVREIEDALGAQGTKEKACEVAYMAFEAMCVDVARLNGLSGGTVSNNAEQGADLIHRRYVINRGKSGGALPPASMFDVIMSECQMPTKEMLENRTYLEAAADMFGYAYEEADALVRKYGTQAWVMMKQGVHKAPEVLEAGKEIVLNSAEAVWDWMRVTGTKLKPEIVESFKATWKFVIETGQSIGMTLVKGAGGVVEFVFDKGTTLTVNTYRGLRDIHDSLMTQPEMHEYLGHFEEAVMRLFGIELGELNEEMANDQIGVEIMAIASFYDGGNYPIQDVRLKGKTISDKTVFEKTKKIEFIDGAMPLTPEEVKTEVTKWSEAAITAGLLGAANSGKKLSELTPALQRYVIEVIQANLFKQIASNPELKKRLAEFATKTATLRQDVANAERKVKDVNKEISDMKAELKSWKDAQTEWQSQSDKEVALNAEFLIAVPARKTAIRAELVVVRNNMAKQNRIMNPLIVKYTVAGVPGTPDILEKKITVDKEAELTLTTAAVQDAERQLKSHQEKGIDKVQIPFRALLNPPPIDLDILTPRAGDRNEDLLGKNVKFADRKLLYIPLNWMLGDAEYVALEKEIVAWRDRKLALDPGYQLLRTKDNRTSDDLASLNSYQRYLEHIATSEVFLRAMTHSRHPTIEEQQNGLHISLEKARCMHQFLEEREGLVSFNKFREVWTTLTPAPAAAGAPAPIDRRP
ncbi:MAG: hypothetical protein PHE68_04195 [Candidatus Peribacteraceae bacterium]|nr:hypothetical protein [Candidatus Peribacteraceae bacterium]